MRPREVLRIYHFQMIVSYDLCFSMYINICILQQLDDDFEPSAGSGDVQSPHVMPLLAVGVTNACDAVDVVSLHDCRLYGSQFATCRMPVKPWKD